MRALASLAFALTAAGVALAGAPPAFGHASFLEALPAPGASVARSPELIALEFTEPLNEELTRIELIDERGRPVPSELVLPGGGKATLRPTVKLARGAYRISWYTVSTLDGHPLEGEFAFGLRTAALPEQKVEQSPLEGFGWLRIIVRAGFYAALFLFAGGSIVAAMLSPRAMSGWLLPADVQLTAEQRLSAQTRARRLTLVAAWLATLGALAVAAVETLDATGGVAPADLAAFLLGNQAGVTRILTAALLAAGALVAPRSTRIAAALGAASLAAIAFGGHATGFSPALPAVISDWLHLLAGAVWIGGLSLVAITWLPLAFGLSPGARKDALRLVLGRFGRLALPAALLVVATGTVNAAVQLEHPTALWETDYGRVLAAKVALVALVAVAGYRHAFRLRPRLLSPARGDVESSLERRHWRLLSAEAVLGVGVLGIAAALVAFPLPPRDLPESAADQASACDPCPVPEPRGSELAVAESLGDNIVALWADASGAAVVRTYDVHGEPVAIDLQLEGGSLTVDCGLGCRRARLGPGSTRLLVSAEIEGVRHSAALPVAWAPHANRRAARLASRAQATMRGLSEVRIRERTTSGPGTAARFNGRLRASRDPRIYRQVFRWGRFTRTARLLGRDPEDGRGRVRIALLDRGAPSWFRILLDARTGRVLEERLITTAHFIDRRYGG